MQKIKFSCNIYPKQTYIIHLILWTKHIYNLFNFFQSQIVMVRNNYPQQWRFSLCQDDQLLELPFQQFSHPVIRYYKYFHHITRYTLIQQLYSRNFLIYLQSSKEKFFFLKYKKLFKQSQLLCIKYLRHNIHQNDSQNFHHTNVNQNPEKNMQQCLFFFLRDLQKLLPLNPVNTLIISRITPAARRASVWPTIPWDTFLASKASSNPKPRMCEWAPV